MVSDTVSHTLQFISKWTIYYIFPWSCLQ